MQMQPPQYLQQLLTLLRMLSGSGAQPWPHLLLFGHTSMYHGCADTRHAEQRHALCMHLLSQLPRRQHHQHTRLHRCLCCCCCIVRACWLLLLLLACRAAAEVGKGRKQVRQGLATTCTGQLGQQHSNT